MGSPIQHDQGGLTLVVGGLAVASAPGATPTSVVSSTGAVSPVYTTTALSATSPSTLTQTAGDIFTVTPNATLTINATDLVANKRCTIIFLTSGTTSYTVTFGTNFKSTGTLATGTTSARYFVVQFVSDGTNLYEVSRTTAMA